ncbi:glycosyltransferase family 2 protein [Exiguobacterium chiriqhucha]|uniref:glycosyltransferase family 2 protein n=1 Tax=Exiguobacterium chiriqhucha TaxID=1385984 RepID=UPI0038BCB7FD
MNKISAVIITKNEEANLEECLKSLHWVDEIIIVDSYSTDSTKEIARKYTPYVYERSWTGYTDQRNYGATKATNEWILSIDADERITEKLSIEIKEKLGANNFVAFKIPMQNYVFNRWMNHSGLGNQYHTRLYNKKYCEWDSLIHEDIVAKGNIGKMNEKMLHLAYMNVSELIYKIDKYTDLEAEKLIKLHNPPSTAKLLVYPYAIFLYKYLFQKGFKDGISGFAWAASLSYYHQIKLIKYFLKKDMNK